MEIDPTLIGVVQDVSGSTVTVELTSDTVTGLLLLKVRRTESGS